MNRFVAPQFIDVEDKIIGPITTRQFVIIIIGFVLIFLAYKILDTTAFGILTFVVIVSILLFGFVKINGRRFHVYVASMFEALSRPKIRVWFKDNTEMRATLRKLNQEEDEDLVKSDVIPTRANIETKRLSELALLVDTGGRFSAGDDNVVDG